MKKIFLFFFTAVCCCTLSSCGGGDDGGSSSGGSSGGGTTPQGSLPSYTVSRSLAFPGAEGGGSKIVGGAGGNVIRVTNLNDSGSGSLRYALSQSGSRTIVFTVGGTIYLQSPLDISEGYVTVAGQTAPGDGITLAGCPVTVSGNNVILRFLRFRLGEDVITNNSGAFNAEDGDALGAKDCNNVLIDHCSISWSIDECASFSRIKNFTLQYSIISESLRKSVHVKGNHGYGGIWGGANATYHHNLLADHDSRNPRFDHQYVARVAEYMGPIDYVNNVVYNWGSNSTYGGEGSTFSFNVNMINNYYKPGPSTSSKDRLLNITTVETNCVSDGYCKPIQAYLSGNYVNGVANKDWDGVVKDNKDSRSLSEIITLSKLSSRYTTGLTIMPTASIESATDAYNNVLSYAGASLARDAVDKRIIEQVRNNTGALINSPAEVGGYPVLKGGTAITDMDSDGMDDVWERKVLDDMGCTSVAISDFKPARYNLSSKYTNLEVYLNSLVVNTFPSGAGASEIK